MNKDEFEAAMSGVNLFDHSAPDGSGNPSLTFDVNSLPPEIVRVIAAKVGMEFLRAVELIGGIPKVIADEVIKGMEAANMGHLAQFPRGENYVVPFMEAAITFINASLAAQAKGEKQ